MTKINIPISPIVLSVILGPMLETNLRKSVIMYEGSYSFLYTRPITIFFLFLTFICILLIVIISSIIYDDFHIGKYKF